jgi:hypothetical protein
MKTARGDPRSDLAPASLWWAIHFEGKAMRYAVSLLALLALMMAACGDEDAEREAEARAEIESVRADYEAREANIARAIETAQEWRGKEGVPALDWGDRPPAKWLDVRKNKFDKEANGHVYELTPEGEFNTDAMSLLGLFTDTAWRDTAAGRIGAGEGYLTRGGVRGAFDDFMRVRYLCLVITDEYKAPELGDTTLSTVKFTPGEYRGRALYFDLEDGELIGGREIDVRNSSNIEFKSGVSAESQLKGADNAAAADLRAKIDAIVRA